MDFAGVSSQQEIPPFLSTYSRYSGLWEAHAAVNGPVSCASITWATGNQARYYPISIPFYYPVNRVWWINGSAVTGTRDFGIYSTDGERLYSTGSTAVGSASVPQFVDNTDILLAPGDYYFGFNCSATTNAVFGITLSAALMRFGGVLQQAVGAVTLPDPFTAATSTVAGVNICGVTWTDSGF